MTKLFGKTLKVQLRSDLLAGVAVMGILGVMLIPMPTPVMDILIALNITMAVVILLISLYIFEPISFSVFPTLLLMLTLFRLSLNVASTRLILLNGNAGVSAAGKVIKSFGEFVVGGNYVVGAVIFLVLLAIQFIVVNHGAVRVSEVSARFTLDAMPGKQMSIDADLNSGLINENEARARRKRISDEAEFYGSMDGAVRFTQRDAVASIIITLINIIAGFVIGVFQLGFPLAEALKTYTILTIGDGLVSAIPALLISVTGGVMTTRVSGESSWGNQVAAQLLRDPAPLALGAGLLLLLALVPGLPFFAFFSLGGASGAIAWIVHRKQKAAAQAVEAPAEERVSKAAEEEKMESLMRVDPLGLELGYQLIHLVDARKGADFLSRVKSIRRQLALDLGVIVPPVHITDNLQLKPREYRILLKGVPIAKAELLPEKLMAINPGRVSGTVEGTDTREPTFNLPARWIAPELRERAQLSGYTVVDNTTVLATHLTEVIKSNIHELLGRQEVKALIDGVNETHPKVVEELIPKLMDIGEVQKILQNLLRERVSIRDLVTILETLADYAPMTKNVSLLTEYVRQALGRSICREYSSEEGRISVFTLAPSCEKIFEDALTVTEKDSYLALQPKTARTLLEKLKSTIEKGTFEGYPVLLTSTSIRLQVRRFIERVLPSLVVISHNEIPPNVKLVSVGVVE
ncbi:MAG: flagellar biosynthesis protein FlhA [Acidobacteriota bacterium]